MLPKEFLSRMEEMLGGDYDAFLKSYDRPKLQALRINHLKGSEEKAKEKISFLEEAVPWAEGGYYYKEENKPGQHPFHEAGVYYIQEPSAMAPVAALMPKPGEKILDLCAAPGGKSTQIADAMKGEGLLVCNEIHPKRAKVLAENIERMGIANALVLNHEPAYLAERFAGYFDRILVDAPCSGEGMFRKNEEACKEWSPENVLMCAERQREILESAALMLKNGGSMVYSTCTFAPAEDEGIVGDFLKRHPQFHLEEIKRCKGMEPGRPEFISADKACCTELSKTVRLWPHKLKGEGHFMALLKKEGERTGETFCANGIERGVSAKDCGEWQEFCRRYLKKAPEGKYLKFGDQLYLVPQDCPSLKGLKVLRAGLWLGTLKKNRFEPSHALALFLKPEDVCLYYDLDVPDARKYLLGQTFCLEGEKGWYLISVKGYSLGFGKLAGGIMKNHYPKGLRKGE